MILGEAATPPFFVLLFVSANTGGLARQCCTSNLNLPDYAECKRILAESQYSKKREQKPPPKVFERIAEKVYIKNDYISTEDTGQIVASKILLRIVEDLMGITGLNHLTKI